MECDLGYEAVRVVIGGISSMVCQAMSPDDARRQKRDMALGLGLGLGVPALLVLLLCCYICYKRCRPVDVKPYATDGHMLGPMVAVVPVIV